MCCVGRASNDGPRKQLLLQHQLCHRPEGSGTPGSCGGLSDELGCCGGLLQQSEPILLMALVRVLVCFPRSCRRALLLAFSFSRCSEGAACPLQSCGICKEMLKHYAKLCKEVQAAFSGTCLEGPQYDCSLRLMRCKSALYMCVLTKACAESFSVQVLCQTWRLQGRYCSSRLLANCMGLHMM